MKTKLVKMLEKTLDALPMTGAAIGLIVLTCVFSGSLRELLLRADMSLLAAAVALLPLSAALLAFTLGMRNQRNKKRQDGKRVTPLNKRAQHQREVMRRQAMLNATYDLNDQH